jgi:beta-lactam-binding protein with PASTA domain
VAPPTPPPQAAPPPKPEHEDSAAITLRLPDREGDKNETLALGINPGERERVLALVRNQSGIVDNYELSVHGLPRDWWSIFPDTVYLVPFGSGGTYEQEVEIHLHPPKTAEAEARIWELQVAAQSKAYGQQAAAAPLLLGIQPFEDSDTKVKPERAAGRRKAKFEVSVKNKANAPLLAAMEASDQDNSMGYEFTPAKLEVHPGETKSTTLVVRPPKQIWLGRPQERRLQVRTVTGEEAAAMETAAPVPEGLDEFEGEHPQGEYAEGEFAEGAYEAQPPPRRRFGRGGKRKQIPGVQGPQVYKPQVYKPDVYIGPGGPQIRKPMVRGPQVMGPRMSGMNLNLSSLKPGGGGGAAVITGPLLPSQAVFRQKPWLPWWLAIVIPLLILAAIALYLLLPKTTEVPDVTGSKSAFVAEKELGDAKLKLAPAIKEKVNTKVAPGTVIGQTPKAGEKVEKESEVAILTATGDGNVEVPKLVGLTSTEADKVLREAKLALGPSTPPGSSPKAVIKTQIPAAKEIVKEGVAVAIFLPKKGEKGDGEGGKGAAGTGAAGGGGGGGGGGDKKDIVIPAIGEQKSDAYAQAAADLGLVPEQVKQFSDKPPGVLFATEPPGGTKAKTGDPVKLLVSGGAPQLAFDDDKNVLLINGQTGKRLKAVAKGSQVDKDPTFSFDGTKIAFTSAGRVFLSDGEKPDEPPFPLSREGEEFADLAWAPTVNLNLLAMLRGKGVDNDDLCFGQITSKGMTPDCIPDPKINLSSVVRWAPDGKSVFARGIRADRFGMVRYRSKKPFSPDARDWGDGKFVTDISNPGKGVIDLAISPDGKRMAAVANFEGDVFQVFLTKPNDPLLTDAKAIGVQACKVIWRSDGKELVVVQADVGCRQGTGQLVRLPIEKPSQQAQLGLKGDNPDFQPLTLK